MSEKLQPHELSEVARAHEYELWRIMKRMLEDELEVLDIHLRTAPKICDDDLTEDFRWKLADQARLKWLLEMPDRAKQKLEGM